MASKTARARDSSRAGATESTCLIGEQMRPAMTGRTLSSEDRTCIPTARAAAAVSRATQWQYQVVVMVTCVPASDVPTPSRGQETIEYTSTYGPVGVGLATSPSKTAGIFGFAASRARATCACVSSRVSVIADGDVHPVDYGLVELGVEDQVALLVALKHLGVDTIDAEFQTSQVLPVEPDGLDQAHVLLAGQRLGHAGNGLHLPSNRSSAALPAASAVRGASASSAGWPPGCGPLVSVPYSMIFARNACRLVSATPTSTE